LHTSNPTGIFAQHFIFLIYYSGDFSERKEGKGKKRKKGRKKHNTEI